MPSPSSETSIATSSGALGPPRQQAQRAAARHRIERVEDEIGQDLAQLRRLAGDVQSLGELGRDVVLRARALRLVAPAAARER
jgi:hypothetical protein